MCANPAFCTALKRAALIADKNVNQLESRKLRMVPDYNTRPHVLRHPTVLYTVTNHPFVRLWCCRGGGLILRILQCMSFVCTCTCVGLENKVVKDTQLSYCILSVHGSQHTICTWVTAYYRYMGHSILSVVATTVVCQPSNFATCSDAECFVAINCAHVF